MLLGVGEVNVLLHGHHHHSPVVLQPYPLPICRLEFVLWDLGAEIWRQSNEYPKNKIHIVQLKNAQNLAQFARKLM